MIAEAVEQRVESVNVEHIPFNAKHFISFVKEGFKGVQHSWAFFVCLFVCLFCVCFCFCFLFFVFFFLDFGHFLKKYSNFRQSILCIW